MMLALLLASVVCTATPVHREPLPQSGSLSRIPWVQATPHRAGVFGMLWAFDAVIAGDPPRFALWAGGTAPPPGPNQKILWVIRKGVPDRVLTVNGRELGGTDTFVQTFQRAYSVDPAGTIYPSIINVPHAGCWRLDVSSGGAKGSLIVQVAVQ